MNLAQALIAVIGLGASFATFCFMRFPHYRRRQFSRLRACSFLESLTGAVLVLAATVFLVLSQGDGRPP